MNKAIVVFLNEQNLVDQRGIEINDKHANVSPLFAPCKGNYLKLTCLQCYSMNLCARGKSAALLKWCRKHTM